MGKRRKRVPRDITWEKVQTYLFLNKDEWKTSKMISQGIGYNTHFCPNMTVFYRRGWVVRQKLHKGKDGCLAQCYKLSQEMFDQMVKKTKPTPLEKSAETFKDYLLDRHEDGSLDNHPELPKLLQTLLDNMAQAVEEVKANSSNGNGDGNPLEGGSLGWIATFVALATPTRLDRALALANLADQATEGQCQQIEDLISELEIMQAEQAK